MGSNPTRGSSFVMLLCFNVCWTMLFFFLPSTSLTISLSLCTCVHVYKITEPPTIAIKPSDTDAPYGSTVLLTCTAFSDDDDYPDITWFRNSEPVTNSSEVATVYTEPITVGGINFTRSILELCPVTLSDEGTYSCVATDSIGTDSANFSFTVFTEGESLG